MSNMEYCRFSNTQHDLGDCYEALRDGLGTDLDDAEMNAKERLVRRCADILYLYGIHIDVGFLNEALQQERIIGDNISQDAA